MARGVQHRPGQRDPLRRRLRRAGHRDGAGEHVLLPGVLREQRGDVAVRPHPQQQYVEERLSAGAEGLVAAHLVQLLAVPGRGVLEGHAVGGGGHDVDVPRREPVLLAQHVQEALAHARLVALAGVGVDEALVAPPQVQSGHVDSRGAQRGGQRRRGEGADGAAGEHQVSLRPGLERLGELLRGGGGGGRGDRVRVGDHDVLRGGLAAREGRGVVDAGEGGAEHLAVDLVGVQAAQLLGDELREGAARHRHVLTLVVPGQPHDDRVVADAAELDRAVLAHQAHRVHAGEVGIGLGRRHDRGRHAEGVLEPGRHQQHRGVALGAGDLDRGGGRDRRDLVGARDEAAPAGQTRPGEVRVAAGVAAAQALEGPQRVRAGGRVGDAALGHRAEHVMDGGGRGVLRPPGDDRRIGQQQRHDQGVQGPQHVSAGLEDHDLAGARVPAHADLRVEAGGLGVRIGVHHDDPRGMLVARGDSGLERLLDVLGRDDDQGEDPADGVLAEGLPHLGHGLVDRGRGGVGQGGDHGRLQVRPSRASMSCAVSGPQEPGR